MALARAGVSQVAVPTAEFMVQLEHSPTDPLSSIAAMLQVNTSQGRGGAGELTHGYAGPLLTTLPAPDTRHVCT